MSYSHHRVWLAAAHSPCTCARPGQLVGLAVSYPDVAHVTRQLSRHRVMVSQTVAQTVRLGHRDLASFLRAVAEACSPQRFREENAVVRFISRS